MSTYLHPDLGALQARLSEQGFIETRTDDFSIWYERGGNLVVVDLPQSEVYDAIEVDFQFDTGISLLVALGFPL